MNKLSVAQKAYVAGFLDGDGSIYVRIKPNKSYRFKFQIAPSVVFFQSKENKKFLQSIQCLLGIGNIRERKDGICELMIQREHEIILLLRQIEKYLKLKRKQAQLI